MELSAARATTADVDVGACEGREGTSETPAAHAGNAGGSLGEAGALAGAASIGASAEWGVPTEVSVFRFCEAGTISPVPIKVAKCDLYGALRCVSAPRTEVGAGVIERAAGAIERGMGVTECSGVIARGAGVSARGMAVTARGAGIANGNPFRDDGGAVTLAGATGKLTLGNVELREGTGRGWATEPEDRSCGPKNAVISECVATRSRATIEIAVASSAQSAKR
jgi:hypothetical protein